MSEEVKLAAALVRAQSSAQAVAKSSRNEHHKYNYSSAEAIIVEAREALATSGLALVATGWKIRSEGNVLCVDYRLFHVSGETMPLYAETTVVPGPGRPQDKAEAAALTYSLGYLLRSLLLLPRVDKSNEVDARNDEPAARSLEPALVASTVDAYLKAFAACTDVNDLTVAHTKMKASGLTDAQKASLTEQARVRRAQIQDGRA